jgi:hypothetical protein
MLQAAQPEDPQRVWMPQPGPQEAAWSCPVTEIFFGGTRGGGKTDNMLGRQIYKAEKYGIYHNGLIIRRKYKDFSLVRRRIDELIMMGLPAERVGGENQVNYIRFKNGALITMLAILRLEQADSLQGEAFTEISVDEGPTIPFISSLIDRLKGCLRSAHGVPCNIFITGNPGGPGASQISAMYIGEEDGGSAPVPEGTINRIEQTMRDGTVVHTSRIFIRSSLWDNPALVENDPLYEARLRSINNPQLVEAWLSGKWDVFVGQAFNFGPRHIIPPIWPIPPEAPLYMTYDWGFGAPFSFGWWWVDADDRIYRFAEWYGWDEVTPNVGLRLTDQEMAAGIVEREKKMGIWGREITRLCDPTSFNKKADYKGGGQGDSTSDEFLKYAEILRTSGDTEDQKANLTLYPGDADKGLKIRQFRNRLLVPKDPDELPMLVVYNTCKQFIRIIPTLCVDELTGEYLEDGQELHPFDETCHICMARPRGADMEELEAQMEKSKKEANLKRLDRASRSAALEYADIEKQLRDEEQTAEDLFYG